MLGLCNWSCILLSLCRSLYFAQSMLKPVFCSVYAEACILLSLCWSLFFFFFFFSPISLGTKFLGWVNFLQKLLSIVCYYKHSNPDQWLLNQFLNPYAVFIPSRNGFMSEDGWCFTCHLLYSRMTLLCRSRWADLATSLPWFMYPCL